MVLREHGSQGWNLTRCLEDFDVAFHRYDKKVNPFEVFCLTMLACCAAVAHEADDATVHRDVRDAARKTLKTVTSANMLCVGINTDRMICDRRLIHMLERGTQNCATRPRRLRTYIEETTHLILDAALLAEGSTDTFTQAVWSQICMSPVFVGGGEVQSLSDFGQSKWATTVVRTAQHSLTAVHQGLRQILHTDWLENHMEAFDVHQWMKNTGSVGDVEVRQRMVNCCNRLCDAKYVPRNRVFYQLIMDHASRHYAQQWHSNGDQEVMDTLLVLKAIAAGFEDAKRFNPAVKDFHPVVSFFIAFSGESCSNERNHSCVSMHVKSKTKVNVQHANDCTLVSRYGPSDENDIATAQNGCWIPSPRCRRYFSLWGETFGHRHGCYKERSDKGVLQPDKVWKIRPLKRRRCRLQFAAVGSWFARNWHVIHLPLFLLSLERNCLWRSFDWTMLPAVMRFSQGVQKHRGCG